MTESRIGTASVELYKRANERVLKKSRKRTIRYAILVANILLLALAIGFIAKNSNSQTARQSASPASSSAFASNPLDQLSSADIALEVARLVHLDQVVSVKNNAESINDSLTVAPAAASIVAKPQVISTVGLNKSNKDVLKYVTQAGDNVGSLAAKFGITSNTIRWSNDLTGDGLAAGRELLISPIDGIVYKVKPGDTPESLAARYRANRGLLVNFNNAENGLTPGELIVIPGGSVQVVRVVTPTYYGFAWGASAAGYNGYDFGWCTWWVAKRRADIGRPLPTNLGNAYSWYSRAAAGGLTVSPNVPIYGAAMWTVGGNHVSFVEKMLEDGSIIVSDMNSRSGWQFIDLTGRGPGYGGWNVVSYRRIEPSQFGSKYKFIH